jgi:hypothetical protein
MWKSCATKGIVIPTRNDERCDAESYDGGSQLEKDAIDLSSRSMGR